MKSMFKHSVTGVLCLLLINPVVWACGKVMEFPRPQCQESQLHYGICFNPNMDEAVRLTRHSSYRDVIRSIVQRANERLDTVEPGPRKVIITDLDETLVNNVDYYEVNKVFKPDTWQEWIQVHTKDQYFPEVLALLKKAKQKGFAVMFITGRPADQVEETVAQVSEIQWDGVFLRPKGSAGTTANYKTAVRNMLRQLGYDIVLNLGDQASDFDVPINPEEGEFLLPNVMYSTP